MTGDSTIRKLTDATALLVAVIAAVVSFIHIEDLAVTHGQTRLAAWLLPVSVDGTVAAASLSMLWAARSGLPTPWLARCMLTLGVLATLAANVGYGAPYGLAGELLSGWPAVAFVGSVEMVLAMVRRARTAPEPVLVPPAALNGYGRQAAELFAAELAAGQVPSIRRIRREMRVGQPRAQQVRGHLAALAEARNPLDAAADARSVLPGQAVPLSPPDTSR